VLRVSAVKVKSTAETRKTQRARRRRGRRPAGHCHAAYWGGDCPGHGLLDPLVEGSGELEGSPAAPSASSLVVPSPECGAELAGSAAVSAVLVSPCSPA